MYNGFYRYCSNINIHKFYKTSHIKYTVKHHKGLAKISAEDMAERFEKIKRIIYLPAIESAQYMEPPHLVLCTVPSLSPGNIVATAAFWMLGRKPSAIPWISSTITLELWISLDTIKRTLHSDQLMIFLGMASLMTMAKELQTTGATDNHEYL